jgi:hypothetical protein
MKQNGDREAMSETDTILTVAISLAGVFAILLIIAGIMTSEESEQRRQYIHSSFNRMPIHARNEEKKKWIIALILIFAAQPLIILIYANFIYPIAGPANFSWVVPFFEGVAIFIGIYIVMLVMKKCIDSRKKLKEKKEKSLKSKMSRERKEVLRLLILKKQEDQRILELKQQEDQKFEEDLKELIQEPREMTIPDELLGKNLMIEENEEES